MISIYGLADSKGTIRYVGQSADPVARLANHVAGGSRATADWIVAEGRPTLVTLEEVTEGAASDAEIRWIERFSGPLLLNKNSTPRTAHGSYLRQNTRGGPRGARKVMFSTRLSPELLDRIRAAAQREGKFMAPLIERWIVAGLDALEEREPVRGRKGRSS